MPVQIERAGSWGAASPSTPLGPGPEAPAGKCSFACYASNTRHRNTLVPESPRVKLCVNARSPLVSAYFIVQISGDFAYTRNSTCVHFWAPLLLMSAVGLSALPTAEFATNRPFSRGSDSRRVHGTCVHGVARLFRKNRPMFVACSRTPSPPPWKENRDCVLGILEFESLRLTKMFTVG